MRETLTEVLDIWMSEHGEHLKDRANLHSVCRTLADALGRDTPVAEINTAAVHKYVAQHKGVKAPATVKKNLGVLQRALTHYCRQHPGAVAEINWPKLRIVSRQRFMTEEEQHDLVNSTNDMVQFLVVLLLDTGMRLGEAQGLRYSDWTGGGTITVHRPKTGTTTWVPVSRRLFSALAGLDYYDDQSTPLVPEYQWGTLVRFVRHAINKINDANEKAQAPEHVRHGKITIHTLRDTFATNMLRRGLPIQDVSYLLGHSNIQQTMKYAHVCPTDVVDRARDLLNGE